MPNKEVRLRLSEREAELNASILGFIEAGDVSGGPLDAESKRQITANLRVFESLSTKLALARACAHTGKSPSTTR